jgi:hypothetical protein
MTTVKNANLNSPNTKNTIFKYLKNQNDINTTIVHDSIMTDDDLDVIRDNDYVICPQYIGQRVWIIFKELKGVYYAVYFNKSNLNEKTKINSIDIMADKDLYCGTIMEGIYYYYKDIRYLCIDDVYYLSGKSLLLQKKIDRINNLSTYIKTKINQCPKFQMVIVPCHVINKKNLTTLFDKIRENSNINELIFYPQIYGQKVYSYPVTNDDTHTYIVRMSYFKMRKTDTTDIYNIHSLNTDEKIGIAFIPDIETSKKCKKWFSKNKKDGIIVKCKMENNSEQWKPLEVVDITTEFKISEE